MVEITMSPELLAMIKRANECVAEAAKSGAARKANRRRIKTVLAQGTFAGRGFSTRTCNVLREHGVFTPERLLVMPLGEISRMRGVGKFAFAEIASDRARHQG